MIFMQLPGWLQSWKWDQRWQETGFEFLDEAAFWMSWHSSWIGKLI